MNSKAQHNHLFKLANTSENREIINMLRKAMVKCDSKWKLDLKGRKPVDGVQYGHGGNLKLKDAKEFAVYVRPRNRDNATTPRNEVFFDVVAGTGITKVDALELQVEILQRRVRKLELHILLPDIKS